MKIEAAVSRVGQPHPVIETLDIEEPRAGEILVRIVATGICHTDLKVHAGQGARTPLPAVLGHEGAGVVECIGEGVRTVAVGDRVVLSGSSCGVCPSCLHSFPSYCLEMLRRNFSGSRLDGSSPLSLGGERIHAHFFGQSSFARYAIAGERSAVKVAADVPLELLGPLGCGILTGAGAVLNAFSVGAGDSLAVFGSGGVGLAAIMAARLVGVSRIIAIDRVPRRLELARELGATHTLDATHGDTVAAIREITGHGADFSFNTTLAPEVFTQALECLAMRGTAGFVAAPLGEWRPAMFPMLAGGRRLQGIVGGDAAPQLAIPMLIDYYRQGRFAFDRLVRFYRFEEIATAFRDMEHGECVKPVLRM